MCHELYLAFYTKRKGERRSHSHSERANGTRWDYRHVHYVRSHNSTSGKIYLPFCCLHSQKLLLTTIPSPGSTDLLWQSLYTVPAFTSNTWAFYFLTCLPFCKQHCKAMSDICKKHSKCLYNPERLSEVKQTCLVTELSRTLARLWAVCSTTTLNQFLVKKWLKGAEGQTRQV